MEPVNQLYIGGRYVSPHAAATVPLVNPATETQIGTIANARREDIDVAASTARRALADWAQASDEERAACLGRLADLYDKQRDDMALLVTRQNGSVITRSRRTNGTRPVDQYRYFARRGASFAAETVERRGDSTCVVRREPVGVVGAIVPWNAPQSLLAHKLGPALLAGCTIVVKPSPETSLDAFRLAEMAEEAGVPAGVVNIVTGDRETGAAIVEHPGIDKVSFTGSTAAGRTIAAICGKLLKPMTAELGGKSAAVVLDDADLDVFSDALIPTCLPNTGQVCYSCTRVVAPRSRMDEVLDAAIERLRTAVLGDPLDPASEFGPLVSVAQRDRVEGYIAAGVAEGARIALGGGRPDGFPKGYYVEPTIFVDVRHDMRIFREEIFGPVIVVVPHDGDEDAVRVANDSDYGLGGSVFSKDLDRAARVARAIETGSIAVNGCARSFDVETTGYKNSGIGGDAGLAAYVQTKAIDLPGALTC